MNDAVEWNEELAGTVANERSSAVRRGILLSCVILAATIGLSAWIYLYGKQTLHAAAGQTGSTVNPASSEGVLELARHVDRIALSITLMAAVGGVGCLLPLFTAAMTWRRRAIVKLEQRADEWQSSASALENQLAEFKRTKDSLIANHSEMEARLKQVNAINATLQAELDKRNRAERALTQRRQE